MWIYDYGSEKDNPYHQQPFVEITHMSYIDNLPNWSYPWHKHPNAYEVTFVLSGNGRMDIGTQSFPLSAGSITVVLPGVSHRFDSEPDSEMRYYTLRFHAAPEDGELQTFFSGLGTAVTSGINYLTYIQDTVRLLFSLHHINGGIVDGTFQTIVLGLLQFTRSLFTNQAMSPQLDSQYSISDIIDYIADNLDQTITLKSLARRFNISESHLNRLFQQAYHCSPINYLIQSRIVMSTEYLAKSNFTITEIAEKVGYTNPTHFTNMFIKRIGCSPSEYRERVSRNPVADQYH